MKEEDLLYSNWATQRGNPEKVRKLKFIGMRGWKGHVQKKTVNGIDYAGEVYDVITEEGLRKRGVFRIPYEEVNVSNTRVDYTEVYIDETTDYHTCGIKAYMSGNFKDFVNHSLILKQKELNAKIEKLKRVFNDLHDQDLKLAVQLYLRRLETPDHYTSKAWKQCTIKDRVLGLLHE